MQVLWQNPILRVGLMLAVFAISATALVAVTEQNTREQIAGNEREALLDALNELVPREDYDNQILQDTLTLPPTQAIGTTAPTTVYRARKNGEDKVESYSVCPVQDLIIHQVGQEDLQDLVQRDIFVLAKTYFF